MSGGNRPDVLARLRAAADRGAAELMAFVDAMTPAELRQIAVSLGLIDASLRAAGAVVEPSPRSGRLVGNDDPRLRADGEAWEECLLIAWRGRQAQVARLLVALAARPDRLADFLCEPGTRGGLLDHAVRELVGHLVAVAVAGGLDLDGARRWDRRLAAGIERARTERAAGIRPELEEREPAPAGYDGDERRRLLAFVLAAAEHGGIDE